MAFHLIFLDSFDHYDNLALKWTSVPANTSINTSGAARTGIGCLYCGTPGGPQKAVGTLTNWICGHAFYPTVLYGRIMIFYDTAVGEEFLDASINADGSVSLVSSNSHIQIGQSAPGLISQNEWVYFEYAVAFFVVLGVRYVNIYFRINGQLAITIENLASPVDASIDLVQPSGAFNDQGGFHDDFYIGYSDNPANIQNDFQGAVRIYPWVPSDNESPLQWTPLANANWQETSQIPEPGDAAYVSNAPVGNVDQYKMSPVGGGPVGFFTVPFGQTVIDARLDAAGSASVAPDIGGNIGSSVALSTSYLMGTQPYDVNPATGLPWSGADFATTFMGPKQTA